MLQYILFFLTYITLAIQQIIDPPFIILFPLHETHACNLLLDHRGELMLSAFTWSKRWRLPSCSCRPPLRCSCCRPPLQGPLQGLRGQLQPRRHGNKVCLVRTNQDEDVQVVFTHAQDRIGRFM